MITIPTSLKLIAIATILLSTGSWAAPQEYVASTSCSSPNHPTDSKQAATITADQATAILSELHQIRLILSQQRAAEPLVVKDSAPTPANLNVQANWHSLGRSDAPVTIVEFTDLECPFCRRFETDTFPQLKQAYIDSGKVRFVSLDLPLPMHQFAMLAAEADRCAGDQDNFWQFRKAMFSSIAPIDKGTLDISARQLGLNLTTFDGCLSSQKYEKSILSDS